MAVRISDIGQATQMTFSRAHVQKHTQIALTANDSPPRDFAQVAPPRRVCHALNAAPAGGANYSKQRRQLCTCDAVAGAIKALTAGGRLGHGAVDGKHRGDLCVAEGAGAVGDLQSQSSMKKD